MNMLLVLPTPSGDVDIRPARMDDMHARQTETVTFKAAVSCQFCGKKSKFALLQTLFTPSLRVMVE